MHQGKCQSVHDPVVRIKQSGISLDLRTGPTGHATLFNQWEGTLVFINKQIKTPPQWSKIFKTTDGVGQNQSSFRGSQTFHDEAHNFFKWTAYRKPYWKCLVKYSAHFVAYFFFYLLNNALYRRDFGRFSR